MMCRVKSRKMKTYIYSRGSTDKQEYEQQLRTVRLYLERNGITPDGVFEEKEHGTVQIEKRELQKAIETAEAGDRIIVSEFSRITRLGNEETIRIAKALEKKGVTIFCVRENFSLGEVEKDKNPFRAMSDNLITSFISGSAKLERDNISHRTKSALQAKKEKIKKDGYFISKNGNRIEKLGNPDFKPEDIWKGNRKSAAVRAEKVRSNPAFRQAYTLAKMFRDKGEINVDIANKLNSLGLRTPRGFMYIPASIPQLIRQGDRLIGVE